MQVLHFDPAKPPGACDVSEVWGTQIWTYSPGLVTVSSPKLQILHFVCKRDGITDRETDGGTIQLLVAPIWPFRPGAYKRHYTGLAFHTDSYVVDMRILHESLTGQTKRGRNWHKFPPCMALTRNCSLYPLEKVRNRENCAQNIVTLNENKLFTQISGKYMKKS